MRNEAAGTMAAKRRQSWMNFPAIHGKEPCEAYIPTTAAAAREAAQKERP
jgi:hypothetical protein